MFPDFFIAVLIGFNILVLVYFTLLNSYYLGTSVFSVRALRRYSRRLNSLDVDELLRTAGAPPVSVIMPAYNEELNAVESVRSLLSLRYPEHEIIVVNDGSTDETLGLLMESFDLRPGMRARTANLETADVRALYRSATHPNLWVLDKENGGKADALNAGLNYCQTPLFCAVDADSILEQDALMRLVRPFLEDGSTVAAGGIVRVANGCSVEEGFVGRVRLPKGWLARFQVVEYLRAFLAGRMGWAALDVLLIISGAFGIFRRSAVVEAGGYLPTTVGEDMELVVRLHRHFRERKQAYRITFVPDPVAWTECPESFRVLGRQRNRWQRGLLQSLRANSRMLANPRYGRIGTIAFPYFWFLEGLGPLVEVMGYVAFALAVILGIVAPEFILAFLLLAFVFGIVLSLAAVALEELVFRRYTRFRDFAMLLVLAVLENFGYRQLLAYWRMKGVVATILGLKGWGRMERKGLSRPRLAVAPGSTGEPVPAASRAITPARMQAGR